MPDRGPEPGKAAQPPTDTADAAGGPAGTTAPEPDAAGESVPAAVPAADPGSRGAHVLFLARRHWPLWMLLALATATRLPLVLAVHARATSDSYFYVTSAVSIAAGRGYAILGHPTAFFPVGWPAFLAAVFAAFGHAFRVAMLAGLALWLVSVALVYVFAVRMGGRLAGTVAGLLVVFSLDLIPYVLRAASENLFVPLLLVVALLLQRRCGDAFALWRSISAGVFLGLAILVRSTALLLPPFVALWMWLSTRRRGHALLTAAVFVAAAYLVVSPWVVRNLVVMKTLAVSTNGGFTLWLGDNPLATGGNAVRGKHPDWQLRTAAAEVADNSRRTRQALSFMLHDPGKMALLVVPKAVSLFEFSPATFENAFTYQPRPDPIVGPRPRALTATEARILADGRALYPLARVLHDLFWVGAVVALGLAVWKRAPGAAFVAVAFVFWVVLHVTVVHGQARYVVSVQPPMAAPLGWLVAQGWARVGARRQPDRRPA